MSATLGSCGCGCGEPTPRRYRPGHDARHKSSLLAACQDRRWWVRNEAIEALHEAGWSYMVPTESLLQYRVVQRYRGRIVRSIPMEAIEMWVVGPTGQHHAHAGCPCLFDEVRSERPEAITRWGTLSVRHGAYSLLDSCSDGWAVCDYCVERDTLPERIRRACAYRGAADMLPPVKVTKRMRWTVEPDVDPSWTPPTGRPVDMPPPRVA